MYYGKLMIVKLQLKERIYLYKDGDECIDITGGWISVGGAFTKRSQDIRLSHLPSSGRVMKTVNNIQITQFDRVFIKIMSVGNQPNYSFRFGVVSDGGATLTKMTSRQSGKDKLSLEYFTPNVPAVLEYFPRANRNLPIGFVNNFGTLYAYEVYIEKYE